MKNLTFKAAMLKGSQPTVNRQSADGQSQRHYKQTPLSKRWKVLMTLVFLFTFAIGNVWAADITVTPPTPNNASNPFSTGLYVMSFSGTGSKLSSGAITTGTKGAVITINFQATKSDMYIKTITFNSLGNGTLSSGDGTFDGQVFTATGNKNSVNVVLTSGSGQKGTVKVTNVVVNTGTNVVETITFTGVDSGDGKKATFTSSAATSALSSITTDASAFSVSSGKLSWANGKKVILTAESNIKYVAFSIADGKMYDSFSAAETTYNSANYSWSGSSKTVTLTNGSGGGREIKGLYVIIDPVVKHHVTYSLGGDYGTTPTQADVAEGGKFTLHNGTTGITAPTGKQFGGWNDGTTTYAGGAEYTMGTDDVELTAVWETAKTNPTATFSNGAYVVGASALDLSSLWTDATSDGAVTYALKVASDDATVSGTSFTATKAGSYVVVATQAATATYNALVKEATITVTWPATGAATITYNVKVGTSQTTLATDNMEATSSSISNLVGFAARGDLAIQTGGGKAASSPKIETPATKDDAKYVDVSFEVAEGKIFTISSVNTKIVAVSHKCSLEVVLSDGVTTESLKYEQGTNGDPGENHEFEFAGKAYEGTVTLKMYAYGAEATTYRIGKPLTISGTVAVKPSPSAPSITAPTEDQTAVYDINDVIAPLTITATGYPAPTYQWYKNSTKTTEGATAISGAESASYTPANDVASDLYYYCVLTNSQGTATSHYFHVTVNAPTVPTIYTETTALTLTSNKVATASETFTFSGANLGETAVTLVLASEVDGLTLSESSVTPTAGAIADTEITVSYKSVDDVAETDVNLYLKQGDNILHTIALTYSSTAGIEDLTSISSATTWNWDGAADAAFGTLDQNAMIVLANADVTWDAGFNALAIAGKLQHYYRDSKYAQGHELKFNTTIPGRVYVTYSNTGNNAARTVNINGTKGTNSSSNNKAADIVTDNALVSAGDVLIKGIQVSDDAANMLRYYKVEFVPTYTVAYAANGGSGDMTDANAYVAGDEVTLLANTFTPASGFVWSGWAVTKTASGDPIEVSEGKFTMPAEAVTVTAQWEDNSKVAKIGDNKYTSLEEALEHAADGTIELLQDIDVTAQVEVEAGVTAVIDLAGHKIEYTGTSILPSGVILVHNGASLTIDDSSDPDAGSIVSGEKAYAAIALTKAGDDAANPATLVVNGGALTGYYYGITGNGSRNNTVITINGGTITGTVGIAIYHPQVGTLTVNNGSLTGVDAAIEMRAGTLVINNGTFTATATVFSCDPNGSGSTTSGAAIAIAQHTTKKDIEVTINGGTFNGVKALNESNPQVNDPAPQVDLAVTGGDFTGEVSTVDVHEFISGGTFDAAVANENCATGWVPAPADPVTGKYTVEPKDGVCLVKIVPTSTTKGTQTGLYPDGDELTINLSSGMNLGGSGKYIGVKATENFQEGDVLHLNMSTYQNNQNATAYVYGDKNATEFLFDTEEKCDENKDYYITLPAAVNGHKELYIVRTEGNKWNGGPSVMEVTRAMKPMLTAITIDGRDGVIDEANKAVAVQIPYEANLAALTVVPTIVWNEAAATNSIVVNDGSAWIEGANTYKLTDKDGDYTVYTITLTRDVLKHAVKFYDGETLLETLEVEDGTNIAAGDVPADPTKEDYIFQGWAETAGGDVVDVTSFTISAAKNFYAKWVADGAINLINKTTGAINTTNFITGVTATEANSEKAAAWGGTQGASISGVNALGKIVQYNATTNQTKLKIKVYNTNNSDKYVYIHRIIEGKTTEETVETLTATSKTVVTSEFYEFNDTKNRSFYITTNATDVKILQVKVIDDGATPMKQAGEAGYSLNLNKGRVVYYGNSDVTFEGLDLNSASNYGVISSTEFQTVKNISFSISSPVLLKVTTNTAKYYVSQNPDEDGTTATAVTAAGTAEFELTETTNPWYLVPSTTSNVKYTNIAFELPKAATPVIETQPATNHTFDPGDMTATVVATVTEGTLHYQWYKKATVGDDEEVGTDAATLTTTTEGTYYVVVTNVLAGHQNTSVTSDEAELGYRVTNDATLMALSYGTPATAIALEDGVYTYNVELAKGTTDVPALAATATMDGYANVAINNAAEFVNYEASSTVTVKSEDLTETNVYTVNFYVKHDLPQVDVTGTTTWDMTNVSANAINLKDDYNPSKQNVRLLLANIDGVNNNASFNSQALMFEGQHIGRTGAGIKHLAGRYVQFNVTVPGAVFVTFESNGDNARTISINGKKCSRTTAGTDADDYITYALAVEPGSVEIIGYEGESANQYVRISKIEFKAEYSHNRPGLNPANIGTLCWTNNAILGGATLYELAGKNENNKLVFDEVAENRLEAGKPYIFVPENGNTEIKLYNTDTEDALTQGDLQAVNGMHGTFVNLSSANGDLWGNYVISKNHYIYVDSDNVTLKAYRAYITSLDDVEPVNNGPAPINGAPRRRIVMGAQGEQVATGIDNLEASEKPLKLMIDGQMYILRGEKLFDATGRLVK